MEYVYSAMLIHRAGKKIDEETMEKVLTSAGVAVDKARIKATVAALSGVDIDKVLKDAAAVPVAAPVATPAGGEKKEAAKKDEKKDEKSAEDAAAGLGALFG